MLSLVAGGLSFPFSSFPYKSLETLIRTGLWVKNRNWDSPLPLHGHFLSFVLWKFQVSLCMLCAFQRASEWMEECSRIVWENGVRHVKTHSKTEPWQVSLAPSCKPGSVSKSSV